MPDPTVASQYRQAAGFSSNASGRGGRQREDTVMSQVDAAAGAGKSSASSASSDSGAKTHPAASSYSPGPAVTSHVYGSPIEGNGPAK